MKQKWLGLTWPRRVMIFIQAFLILLFLILSCTVGRQQVISYHDVYLRRRTDGTVTTYSGRIDGQKAVFTVSPGPVVEYALGDTRYGPYAIVYDPSAVPKLGSGAWIDSALLTGVEIWEGETRLFRGAYSDVGSSFCLVDADGVFTYSDKKIITTAEAGASVTVAYTEDRIPGPYTILKLALAPDVFRRGFFGIFLLGALLCVLNAAAILYADALFRWDLSFRIRHPEKAEPSDWELFSRWVGWIFLTAAALVLFIVSLNYGG